MNPKEIQYWIDQVDRKTYDLAVSYIKSNSELLNTNLEEFIRNCPPSCDLKVWEMLLKAGIELPDTSLKKYDKLLSDYVKTYEIDYQKSFEDYISYTLSNKSSCSVIDTNLILEETV